MATLTISLAVSGETPTAVNLLTLANGVTGADVSTSAGVTLPKAFTGGSGNGWTCSFTDIGLSLYAYTYQFTWSDSSTSPPESGTKRAGSATGFYAAQTDLAVAVGTVNLAIWTGQDATGTPVVSMVQSALTYADSEIDRLFQSSQFTTGPHLSLGPISAAVCQEAATWYAVDWLYRSRGDTRDEDAEGNHYAVRVKEQRAQLMMYRGGALSWDAARRWPTATAPVACY